MYIIRYLIHQEADFLHLDKEKSQLVVIDVQTVSMQHKHNNTLEKSRFKITRSRVALGFVLHFP